MRRLSLHTSALSDDEYDLYTSSLNEIALADEDSNPHDDAYYETMVIGVREARAWLRGRYSHISAAKIDAILKYFSPALEQGDTMMGGQFFAAIRLVIHAEDGKEVDRALAFVQANPKQQKQRQQHTASPPRKSVELPPPMPKRRALTETPLEYNVVTNDSNHPQPPLHPLQRSDQFKTTSHNPFLPRQKGNPTRSEDGAVRLPPLPPRKPAPPVPSHVLVPPPRHGSIQKSHSRSISPAKSPPNGSGAVSSASSITSQMPATVHPSYPSSSGPPQPPPKPASHITSNLIKQSLQASKAAQTMKKAEEQLEKERVMQVLKSSSVVSGSYSLAGATVSNSSIVIGTHVRNRSVSPAKNNNFRRHAPAPASSSSSLTDSSSDGAPPLPNRRPRQQESSPPMSTSSLEQVALAGHGNASYRQSTPLRSNLGTVNANSPFRSFADPPSTMYQTPGSSPSRTAVDLATGPPPTHPDRKLSSHSHHSQVLSIDAESSNLESFEKIYGPTSAPANKSVHNDQTSDSPTRAFRSHSMHHPSPPLPPLPPPMRRKRPESVQVLPSGQIIFDDPRLSKDISSSPNRNSGLARHNSLDTSKLPGHRRTSLSTSASSISSSSHTQGSSLSHPLSHTTPFDSPLSNIQRTIASLQPKLDGLQLQPRLEKARYKAEAGLSRRGFVRDTQGVKSGLEGEEEEGLVGVRGRKVRGRWERNGDGNENGADDSSDAGPMQDTPDVDDGDDYFRDRPPVEKDNLKWPVGEGWKPL